MCQVMLMPQVGMVSMGVCDHCIINRFPWIDVEVSLPAIEPTVRESYQARSFHAKTILQRRGERLAGEVVAGLEAGTLTGAEARAAIADAGFAEALQVAASQQEMAAQFADLPVFLFGHSRGGGVAILGASDVTNLAGIVTWSARRVAAATV